MNTLFTLVALSIIQAAAICMVGFVFESLAFADENISGKNLLFNCVCGLLYLAGNATIGSFVATQIQRQPFRGILIDLSFLNDGGHVVTGIALALGLLAIKDFFYYWMHRLQHRSAWLWAEHELHHSEEQMNVTTATRHHWLETGLDDLLTFGPMYILFKPPVVTVIAATVLSKCAGYFIHMNSRLNLGRFNRFIANPSTHRIHHSKSPEHIDKNFAAFLPLWDVIFGTYCAPKKGEIPVTGLASGETTDSPLRAAILPFIRWAGMIRMSAEKLLHGKGERNFGILNQP